MTQPSAGGPRQAHEPLVGVTHRLEYSIGSEGVEELERLRAQEVAGPRGARQDARSHAADLARATQESRRLRESLAAANVSPSEKSLPPLPLPRAHPPAPQGTGGVR